MTAMVTPNGISILAMDEAVDALLNAGFTIADRGTDLSEMTVAQLKALCAERGIAVPGRATKAQLIALLGE